MLGAEDQGLPPAVLRACTHCVSLECSREARHISPYLPISPHISPYLTYISLECSREARFNTPNPDPDPNPNPNPSPNPDHNPIPSPDQASFNVAVAGSLIMYDRLRKRTEHARRVGGDVGGQRRLQAEKTAPRLR